MANYVCMYIKYVRMTFSFAIYHTHVDIIFGLLHPYGAYILK